MSFIEKLLKQHRETGNIAPLVRTEQTPTKLNQEQLTVLEQIVAENNDATLDELRYQLEKKTGVGNWSLNGRQDVDQAQPHRQKKTLYPTEKQSERVQQQRARVLATDARCVGFILDLH